MNSSYRMGLGLWAATAAMVLGGCSTTPVLDSKFGASVDGAIVGQTLDPAQAHGAAPVVGLDGVAAANVIARYHKSFTTPPPPANIFAIGVSGSSAGSGGSGGMPTPY